MLTATSEFKCLIQDLCKACCDSHKIVASVLLWYSALSRLCVCEQAVIALMEMGFDEKEVVDALRVNNNQQDAAVCKHSEDHIKSCILCYFTSQLRY